MSDASVSRPVPAAPALPTELLAAATVEPRFDAERLDCYRVALEFQTLAARLLPRRGQAALRDQLERASVSIVLNIAEAAGRFSPPDKARFFGIARGSATEGAAIVDILVARGLAGDAPCRHARGLLLRLVQMLTKLNLRLNR